MSSNQEIISCPICCREFNSKEIEIHVNKCLFLNSNDQTDDAMKRKRSVSPVLAVKNTTLNKPSNIVISPSKKLKNDCNTPSTSAQNAPLTLNSKNETPNYKNKTLNSKTTILNSKNETLNYKSKTLSSTNVTLDSENETLSSKKEMPYSISKTEIQESDRECKLVPLECKSHFNFSIPLAKQLLPKSLEQFFGQNHILSLNSPLRSLLQKGEVPNMILWGPPGCGKTSLANIINEVCKAAPKSYKYVSMCAATAGVKDVQNTVSAARLERKFGRKTVLFMDEIHRFNKRQQDTFLMCVEKGEIILLGATTENPSFCINNALLSRCRVIVMEKLQPESLLSILERGCDSVGVRVSNGEDAPSDHYNG